MRRFNPFLLAYLILTTATGAWAFPGSPISGGTGGGTPDDNSVTSAKVVDNTIKNEDIASDAAIDPSKINGGSGVSSTEFGYIGSLTSDAQTQLNAKEATIGYTPENVANKSNNVNLSNSTTLYPSENAVKTYVDTQLALKQAITAFLTQFLAQCTMGADNVLSCPGFTSPASATVSGQAVLYELTGNGNDAITLKAPDSITTPYKIIFPGAPCAQGMVLVSGGDNTYSCSSPILDNVANPTAAQSYGTINMVAGTSTVTLPTAVKNMTTCVVDNAATASDIIVDVQATDNVVLVGVTQAGGVGITNASGSSLGDYVCLFSPANNRWMVLGKQGTWASQ